MSFAPKATATAWKNQADLKKALSSFLDQTDALRPKSNDKETFDKLIAIVKEATDRNEDVAAFTARLKQAGTAVTNLAKGLKLV